MYVSKAKISWQLTLEGKNDDSTDDLELEFIDTSNILGEPVVSRDFLDEIVKMTQNYQNYAIFRNLKQIINDKGEDVSKQAIWALLGIVKQNSQKVGLLLGSLTDGSVHLRVLDACGHCSSGSTCKPEWKSEATCEECNPNQIYPAYCSDYDDELFSCCYRHLECHDNYQFRCKSLSGEVDKRQTLVISQMAAFLTDLYDNVNSDYFDEDDGLNLLPQDSVNLPISGLYHCVKYCSPESGDVIIGNNVGINGSQDKAIFVNWQT